MICILFRIIEAAPTSADFSFVSTSLVSMHIPCEIFAIPGAVEESSRWRAAARSTEIETIAFRGKRARPIFLAILSRSPTLPRCENPAEVAEKLLPRFARKFSPPKTQHSPLLRISDTGYLDNRVKIYRKLSDG